MPTTTTYEDRWSDTWRDTWGVPVTVVAPGPTPAPAGGPEPDIVDPTAFPRPVSVPQPPTLRVLIRDRNLVDVDEFGTDVALTVEATVRAGFADDITLTFPYTATRYLRWFDKGRGGGSGVVILLDDRELTSGFLTAVEINRGDQQVTLTFLGDTAHVSERVTWFDATTVIDGIKHDFEVMFTFGPESAEDAVIEVVTKQAGPGARAGLRIPKLVIPASQGRGRAGVEETVRSFQPLGDIVRGAAGIRFPDLGFRLIERSDQNLHLDIWKPSDKSAVVWFSADLGSLPNYSMTWQAPTTTDVIVIGRDSAWITVTPTGTEVGADILTEFTDNAAVSAWGMRAWKVVDNRKEGLTGLRLQQEDQHAATAAFTDGAEQVSMTLEPVFYRDGPVFMKDYYLLDKVGMDYGTGVTSAEVLRAMTVRQSPGDGLSFQPTLGGPEAGSPDTAERRRIAQLERALLHMIATRR